MGYGEVSLIVVGAFAVLWILISVIGSLVVFTFSRVKLEPFEDDDEARGCLRTMLGRGMVDGQWLHSHNFHRVGVYRVRNLLGSPALAAWQREGEATYLCLYLIAGPRVEMDVVTVFDDRGLTTGTTKDGQLLPARPGSWVQTFSVSTAEELWNHHVAGLEYIFETTGLRPGEPKRSLEEDFVRAIVGQGEYIRSLPLWPLRIPIWYFLRRNVRHNKTIRQLMEG
ncbi:MAG TPA: hypothetical protein EYP56_07435 [Planctomycetaceae bacterium]|nr:hypothetical protein [Planctomycetaceae bacterium]